MGAEHDQFGALLDVEIGDRLPVDHDSDLLRPSRRYRHQNDGHAGAQDGLVVGNQRPAQGQGLAAQGQAEVDDLHLPAAGVLPYQHVVRLQVAVQDAASMGRLHAAGDLQGDLVTEVQKRKQAHDIVVTGSVSVVRTLMAHDLVDEYRLLVFPLVLGAGTRLFPDGTAPVNLALVSAQTAGPAVRLIYTRPGDQ